MPPCMTDFDDTLIELVPDIVVCTSLCISLASLLLMCAESVYLLTRSIDH
jgi:hypothetical protein